MNKLCITLSLLLLLQGCTPGEAGVANSRSGVQASNRTSSEIKGAWMLDIDSSGSHANGEGRMMITSQGKIAVITKFGAPTLPCVTKLSAADLQAIERLVLLTKPSKWKRSYVDPNSKCMDVFNYKMAIQVQGEGDAYPVVKGVVEWDDCSHADLPREITELHAAARILKFGVSNDCFNMPFTLGKKAR